MQAFEVYGSQSSRFLAGYVRATHNHLRFEASEYSQFRSRANIEIVSHDKQFSSGKII